MKKVQLNINKLNLTKDCFFTSIKKEAGFSVVEIIITSAIFVLIVTAFTGSLLYFNKGVVTSGSRTRAVFLAKEGIEVVRNIKDEDFGNLVDGTYGLAIVNGQWAFSGNSDLTDVFLREVKVLTIDTTTKEVSSQVSWDKGATNNGSIILSTYFTNWLNTTSSSCSALCQSLGYTDGTCRQAQQTCAKKGEIYEVDGDQYCTKGPQSDTCCCAP